MHALLSQPALAMFAANVEPEPWSLSLFLVWFGPPALLVAVGFVVFFGARAQRRAIVQDARQRGGFGAEPGTTDIGSEQGFGIEQARGQVKAATGRVLAGLIMMFVGVLALLGLTFWRIFS